MQMEQLLNSISINVNEKVYVKDPRSSILGQKIIQESLVMIDDLGMNGFNFKKLAIELNTTESSIYRYFDNKHNLLIYHMSLFWTWLEYRLLFAISNIEDPDEKLEKAIHLIVSPTEGIKATDNMNIEVLQRIIINESTKAFFSKEVDQENKEGFFMAYKNFCKRIRLIIEEINPNYPYAHSLVSTIVEGIQVQKYYADHFITLSDFQANPAEMKEMFLQLLRKSIAK
jgi:AcrR family transcriptional regulator